MPERINRHFAFGLQQAQMLLDGGIPYCDFIDANPPLIVYLNVPPAALARYLGGSPIVVFHLSVLLLLMISSMEIYGLLRKPRMGLRTAEPGLVLWPAISTLFSLVDWYGFAGQREHLFMLLYVPYLFLRILRHRGGSTNAWLAAVLGVTAGRPSLKPHFLLTALGVEIVLLAAARRRRTLLRSENTALASVVTVYVLHWFFVPAAMCEAFFGRWLPLVCRSYNVYDMTTWQVFRAFLDRRSHCWR